MDEVTEPSVNTAANRRRPRKVNAHAPQMNPFAESFTPTPHETAPSSGSATPQASGSLPKVKGKRRPTKTSPESNVSPGTEIAGVPVTAQATELTPKPKKKKNKKSVVDPARSVEDPTGSVVPSESVVVSDTLTKTRKAKKFLKPATEAADIPSDPSAKPFRPPREKTPADELRARLEVEFRRGQYECAVCVSSVKHQQATWSCSNCWASFHLKCVRDWIVALNNTKAEAERRRAPTQSAAAPSGSAPKRPVGEAWEFRCPGCQFEYSSARLPIYTCFCGQQANPDATREPGKVNTPHSCGQKCARRVGGRICKHPCPLQCHPGPCPPCTMPGPVVRCGCGRETRSNPCGKSSAEDFSCGKLCGKKLSCGRHMCFAKCHHGPCKPCAVTADHACRCGKENMPLPCGESVYSCAQKCGKLLDCNDHTCSEGCHSGACAACPTNPATHSTCHCGKRSDLPGTLARKRCSDPIPSCGAPCGAALSCGHKCASPCHAGPCAPCSVQLERPCRCGKSEKTKISCHAATVELKEPTCQTLCKASKTCGRHKCQTVCCPGASYQATSRRDAHPEHWCLQTCDKPLSCGQHTCPNHCHLGPCEPCAVTIREPLSCTCGASVRQPPQRCGTSVPHCSRPCSIAGPLSAEEQERLLAAVETSAGGSVEVNLDRALRCGHKCLAGCHEGPCPPCLERVPRACAGGHQVLPFVLCSGPSITCSRACGRTMACGHACRKPCHRVDGVDEDGNEAFYEGSRPAGSNCDDSQACSLPCGRAKALCGHPCTQACHSLNGSECPESAPCSHLIDVSCACGVEKQRLPCGSHLLSPGQQTPQQVECTEACRTAARLAQLKVAFEVRQSSQDEEAYDSVLVGFARRYLRVVESIEQRLRAAILQGETTCILSSDLIGRRSSLALWLIQAHYLARAQVLVGAVDGGWGSQHAAKTGPLEVTFTPLSREPTPLLSQVAASATDPSLLEPPSFPFRDGSILRFAADGNPGIKFDWLNASTTTYDLAEVFAPELLGKYRVSWRTSDQAIVEFINDASCRKGIKLANERWRRPNGVFSMVNCLGGTTDESSSMSDEDSYFSSSSFSSSEEEGSNTSFSSSSRSATPTPAPEPQRKFVPPALRAPKEETEEEKIARLEREEAEAEGWTVAKVHGAENRRKAMQ